MAELIRSPFGEPVAMRKAYGEALVELGRNRTDVVVLSADVSNSDFSFMFEAVFPERFFNVGIAEPASSIPPLAWRTAVMCPSPIPSPSSSPPVRWKWCARTSATAART